MPRVCARAQWQPRNYRVVQKALPRWISWSDCTTRFLIRHLRRSFTLALLWWSSKRGVWPRAVCVWAGGEDGWLDLHFWEGQLFRWRLTWGRCPVTKDSTQLGRMLRAKTSSVVPVMVETGEQFCEFASHRITAAIVSFVSISVGFSRKWTITF